MTKPLALLLHEKLMPGSQLASRLDHLDYRVQTLADPAQLIDVARREMPMVVLADLTHRRGDVLGALAAMHGDPGLEHIPIVAYASREDEKQREAALKAGVKILATDATILPHLPQFLEAALLVD